MHSVIGMTLFGIPVFLWTFTGVSAWWIGAGFIAGVIYCSGAIPPYAFSHHSGARHGHSEVIRYSDSWQTALSPRQVFDALLDKFPQGEHKEGPKEDTLHIFTGSEVHFRRWGVFTQSGRESIPLSMKIEAHPNEGGTVVSTEVRDNFGWYLEPFGKKLTDEIHASARKFSSIAKDSTSIQY